MLGVAGADEAATVLEAKLHRLGIASDLIRLPGQATITKLRVLSRNQQLLRLDFEDGFPDFKPAALHECFTASLPDCDVVVLSDYQKGALRRIEELIAAARAAGRPVLADPKGRNFDRYRGATLLTPNLAEFETVAGSCRGDQELTDKGQILLERLELGSLLITRGELGMTLLQDGTDPLHLAARAREVYDVTGAGDTVIATLAAGLAAGLASALLLAGFPPAEHSWPTQPNENEDIAENRGSGGYPPAAGRRGFGGARETFRLNGSSDRSSRVVEWE